MQHDLQDALERQLTAPSEAGPMDSLQHGILHLVVIGNYDSAKYEIERYVDALEIYPQFRVRTERYVGHCHDLISAIKMKRNFPGLNALSRSRQQELVDKVKGHFEELKYYLRKIEKVERELKLEDMRSTIWVVKTFFHTTFIVLTAAFLIELFGGLGSTFGLVFNDLVDKTMAILSKLI